MTRCLNGCGIVLLAVSTVTAAGILRANGAEAEEILRFGFESEKPSVGSVVGGVKMQSEGPTSPEFPDFSEENRGGTFGGDGGRIVVADSGGSSPFDFENGDAITIEAWVNPRKVNEGQNVYIIGKGRTGSAENQNWALRLRGLGSARVSFLFRAAGGDFHRWTSDAGVVPGTGWHHVAVSYTFGEPGSIRGYLDGVPTAGGWDMGGETKMGPTVDDDAVWVGSSKGGSAGNSFAGGLDEIVVYRGTVPAEALAERYHFEAQEVVFPEGFEPGEVLVEVYEGISANVWPVRLGTADDQYSEGVLAMFRVPPKYNGWGVRTDRKAPFLVRAYAEVTLPEGDLELLVRSRGGVRLWHEGKVIATTPFLRKGGDAHGKVKEYVSEDPRLRPLPLGDGESKVKFRSPGGQVRFIFDTVAGSHGYRPEVGESLLAYRMSETENFRLAAPGGDGFALNDEEWEEYEDGLRGEYAERDARRRSEASAGRDAYWAERHARAREFLEGLPQIAVPEAGEFPANNAVDRFIAGKVKEGEEAAAASMRAAADDKRAKRTVDFTKDVAPILEEACFRCHGEKEKGDLRLDTRVAAMSGGESGDAAIVPGDPAKSYLIELVKDEGDDRMPPKGDALGAEEVALLEKWIAEGAHYATEVIPRPPVFSALADDHTFLRRLYLDVVGVIPTPEEAEQFLAGNDPNKRANLIDELLDDPRWADAWVPYWQDVLAENPNILKPSLNNSGPFRYWIHEAFYDNRPADEMVAELVTFQGSTWGGGAAGFKVAAENDVPMAAKAHILGTAFLGVEMKCARCHDAPFHESVQSDLFELAAMLESKPIKIPKSSSVPGEFFEGREARIEVTLKPGQSISPAWPFGDEEGFGGAAPEGGGESSRQKLANLITRPDNRRFAEVMVNRIWKRYVGEGIVEPVFDWEGNAPSHPELLDFLAREFVASGYDFKHVARLILNSHLYQREAIPAEKGVSPERRFFAGPVRRRMGAEEIVDSLYAAAGVDFDTESINFDVEGYHAAKDFLNLGEPGRAWEFNSLSNERDRPSLALPKAQAFIDTLAAFGWRISRQEPVSERDEMANVLQPGAVANGLMAVWVTRFSEGSAFTGDALESATAEEFVNRLFVRILTRPPTEAERAAFVGMLEEGFAGRVVAPSESGVGAGGVEGPRVSRQISWANHLSPEANTIKVELEREARKGRAPTARLEPGWRQRAEDAVWALFNSPEMVFVP